MHVNWKVPLANDIFFMLLQQSRGTQHRPVSSRLHARTGKKGSWLRVNVIPNLPTCSENRPYNLYITDCIEIITEIILHKQSARGTQAAAWATMIMQPILLEWDANWTEVRGVSYCLNYNTVNCYHMICLDD